MQFHGANKLDLSEESVTALVQQHLQQEFCSQAIRVTDVSVRSYGGMVVSFTTDPEEVELPAPEEPRSSETQAVDPL